MKKTYISFIFIFQISIHLFGQAGALDATFGTGGFVTTSFGVSYKDEIADIAIQSDGNIVAVGLAYDSNAGIDKISLARYNSNGSLDNSFGINGIVTTTLFANFNCSGVAIDLQPDGKILVAAQANDTNTLAIQNGYFLVLRYTSNGVLDNTFGVNGVRSIQSTSTFSTEVKATDMLLQPDGNIVLSGSAYYSSSSEFVFIRLTPTGSLDNTFGTSGVAVISSTIGEAIPSAIALQSDGKIVYSGYIDATTLNYPFVGRLNTNGSVDASFGNSGHAVPTYSASAAFMGITLQSNGNILASGFGNSGALLACFQTNGTYDLSFGTNGYLITTIGSQVDATLYDVTVQSDGKIVGAGLADGAFALMRTSAQGSIDASFGTGGIVQTTFAVGVGSEARAIKIQTDGKIVLGGTNITANASCISTYALTRYDNNITTSLKNYSNKEGSTFYPNPASDHVSFDIPTKGENFTIQAYDLLGKAISTAFINSASSEMDISKLPEGTYTILITSPDRIWRQKLVVLR